MLIHGGTIYDGSGQAPFVGDVALKGDRIVYVGPHAPGRAARTIDAKGKAVSPGFINMRSLRCRAISSSRSITTRCVSW